MITETRDARTGIVRHEIGTVNCTDCRKAIEHAGGIACESKYGDVISYTVNFSGEPIEVQSTPTRTILFCRNRYALAEYEKTLNIRSWEYDGSK